MTRRETVIAALAHEETPGELREIIKETLSVMRKGGGYILAPTHAVPQDVPPENVIAMLEAFKNQNSL